MNDKVSKSTVLTDKLSARTPKKAFDKLPEGLVDLYISNYELLSSIENIRRDTKEIELLNILDIMAEKLHDNEEILSDLINRLTNRNIKLHRTVETDTLWKLSKTYNAELAEISELNNLRNILKPYEKKYLLIPGKS